MGVHELDQVLATAAAAVATTVDVAPPAACSSGHEAQAQAKRLTAAPPTLAYPHRTTGAKTRSA